MEKNTVLFTMSKTVFCTYILVRGIMRNERSSTSFFNIHYEVDSSLVAASLELSGEPCIDYHLRKIKSYDPGAEGQHVAVVMSSAHLCGIWL